MDSSESEIELVIVEDDPNDAELLARVFKKHRITNKIVLLKDGAEALDFFFAQAEHTIREVDHKPQIIILDLKLPKVTGIEVLQKIKSDERTKRIPVVVLTSSKESRDVKDAFSLGVNSYVTKPLKFEEFAKVIAELGMQWMILNG